MPQALVGMELSELRQVLPEHEPGYRAAQIYRAIYREKVADLVQISTLPARVRSELAEHAELGLPQLDHRYATAGGYGKEPDCKSSCRRLLPDGCSRKLAD